MNATSERSARWKAERSLCFRQTRRPSRAGDEALQDMRGLAAEMGEPSQWIEDEANETPQPSDEVSSDGANGAGTGSD